MMLAPPSGTDDDTERLVRPDGLVVRRLRHERGWSPHALIDAIGRASEVSTGIAQRITPNLLAGIEERNESVPYDTLCLVADGFDCDPIDLLGVDASDEASEEDGNAASEEHGNAME